ncbi:hypothetical protein J4422_03600 [Candidatus Pacearchaeota archaeon]|nr:hypothetical protein [Candidatus Pacearchaeota archaeon]
MKVIGFNFTKLSAERLKETVEDIKINTELDFPEIKETKSPFLKIKEELLEAKFEYKVNYEPGLAKVVIQGKVLFSVDEKTANEVLKQWKKKNLPEDFRILLVNVVMRKSALKALTLCDELNLPVHVPLPTLRKNK